MKYLAVLGRQPEISLAELVAQGVKIERTDRVGTFFLAELDFDGSLDLNRFGGIPKIAQLLQKPPLETLLDAPAGKITFGISEFGVTTSDFSSQRLAKIAFSEAMRLKRKLLQQGRSVRIVENKTGVIADATSLHNGLSGKNPRKIEFLHFNDRWYRVTGVQDIDAYAKRDQKRPARDAKIGMLPPKLAQVLLNLAGALPPHARILDPFCGTGVVLQEAMLLGFRAYGTDLDPRMVDFSRRNLSWLAKSNVSRLKSSSERSKTLPRAPKLDQVSQDILRDNAQAAPAPISAPAPVSTPAPAPALALDEVVLSVADATTFRWDPPLDAVVTEGYLGEPFDHLPSGMEIKAQIHTCKTLVSRFLRNLAPQLAPGIPVVMCSPAWLRADGTYLRLNMLDEIADLGYNVDNQTREGLIYHREKQIVARDIIILRKK